jgi:hypothetical protein
VVLKLFVFDVDVYAAQKFFPSAAWVLNFKFIILLCLAAILVLIFRSFSIVVWIAYIVFYPLIVLFWKIQRSLYKTQKWVVAFAILNATVSFFRSIRYNLLVSAITLAAIAVAFEATNTSLLWSAAGLLLLILLLTYVRHFRVPAQSTISTLHNSGGQNSGEPTNELQTNGGLAGFAHCRLK